MSTMGLGMMCFVLVSALCAVSAISVSATKRMTYVSPRGDNNMFLERSSRMDLDSSATDYIHFDGDGAAQYLSQLHSLPASPAAYSFQQIHHQPVQFLHGEAASAADNYKTQTAKDSAKGYDGYDAFQKGILKKFDNKEDSGFYDRAVGHEKADKEEVGHHVTANAAAKGEKGSKFGQVSSHKKGHKTSGYHNVYHKDEYKKEQVFYDESDHSGFSDNHAKQENSFDAKKGEIDLATHSDASHQESEAGSKGFFQKGKSDEGSEGYRGAKGGNRQFSQQSEGGKKISDEFEKRFGFDEKGWGH